MSSDHGPPATTGSLEDGLRAEAKRLGFDALGIAPAVAPPGYPDYLRWLDAGHAASMDYLHRQAPARAHPEHLLPGVKSIIMGMIVYGRGEADSPQGPTVGKIARYARGQDYHRVFWDRLEALLEWLRERRPLVKGRAVCDSAPLMERDFARMAGLGWIAKNTMLIHKRLGSFTLLGALLVDIELVPDVPFAADHCGTCTRCLDACPTGAFVSPHQLDARRCISYWTIEHKGPLPTEATQALDGWAFGCDVCQEVCPWNRKAPPGRENALAARPEWIAPDLTDWITADPEEFRKCIRGTALARPKRAGLLRNAIGVLAQARDDPRARAALARAQLDADPNVAEAARRALVAQAPADDR